MPVAKTFAVLMFALLLGGVSAASANTDLARALEAVAQRDWEKVAQLEPRVSPQAAQDVVTWRRLRASQGSLSEYQAFLDRNADWPGLPFLQRRGESNIPRGADPDVVLRYFANRAPQTGVGALRLAAAQSARGNSSDAEDTIRHAWLNFRMSEEEHNAFVQRHGGTLRGLHEDRLDMLLWDGQEPAARRMFPLVSEGWQRLALARLTLRARAPGVDARIEAVPAALRNDPGLAYERFLWRARKGRPDAAREILSARSTSADALGRPEEWANRRRSLARDLMRDDRDKEAYALASQHFLTEGSAYADLEWLSGFIALRKLNDPEAALQHFRNFRTSVRSPISLGRAGYWQGRALEDLGRDDDAAIAYAFGARYQTSFYGQLAAERAGIPAENELLGAETFPDWRNAPFAGSSVLQAALQLYAAGQLSLAERFMVHLSESLSAEEMGQLSELAFELESPHIALMIAKFAARGGETLQRAYHPVTDLVAQRLSVEPALALAIARRESEFDPAVVSPAGARGLMQLMPKTGEAMAGKLGESFTVGRLLTDPRFNARLGTAYLEELIEEFGMNLPLVAAGYNAGPSRARAWRGRFGDPRSGTVDVVDWIEHVPFRETRNYIMRVTESYVVYDIRLSGKTGPIEVTKLLTGR